MTDKGEERRGWFILIYKLPAEPTRLRASVWRKLRAAGAVYLQRAFGEARDAEYVEILSKCRDFHAELEKERAAGKFTFAELEENEEDLAKLGAWLRKVEVRDRFSASLASEARAAVMACREDLEAFAASVYEAADHGSAGSPPSGP
jgi:tRNA(Ile2) C34 agmatinyltransferase TiaS